MRGEGDLGLGRLSRSVGDQAESIRRRATGRGGGLRRRRPIAARIAAFIAIVLALQIALPPLAWPVLGPVTSAFFFRHKPDSASPLAFEFHRGLDIAAASGTLVLPTAPGVVVETGSSSDLGNYVRVRHLFGLISTYGHLSKIDAAPGRVLLFRGLAVLGEVGSTGRSTGPHLHFALQWGGLLLPPRIFLVFHSLRRAIVGF
jgi:murein DD-endopeptidase MepM/ murein hydrolase activator NlpD